MKTLIIQLARPGDIFCTWPVLSALRRQNSHGEIHFLVRKKFASACKDFSAVDHFWHFDSGKWFKPILEDSCKINEATQVLGSEVAALRQENFDQIINLSFSPSSSYLTHLIATPSTEVRGYTRTQDFYLHIPDEASQYFKSQVGLDKSNRIHLYDLFGMIADCEITDKDLELYDFVIPKSKIVCHLGASQQEKTWPKEYWSEFINRILDFPESITLVGGAADSALAEEVLRGVKNSHKVENLVGKTDFRDLAKTLSQAKVFIGADSGPLHVANSVGALSLNLSIGPVNFWETGPTTKGSQILVSKNPSMLLPEEVAHALLNTLGKGPSHPHVRVCDGQKLVRYDDKGQDFDLGWEVVQWVYFNGPKPKLYPIQQKFLLQIQEVCLLALEQLEVFKKDNTKTQSLQILEQADEILKIIEKTDQALSPILRKFACEKENIEPAEQGVLIERTAKCYQDLQTYAQRLNYKETLQEVTP